MAKNNKIPYYSDKEQGVKSARELALEAKDIINPMNQPIDKPNKEPCGYKNPCVFGEWNKNFNKDCL